MKCSSFTKISLFATLLVFGSSKGIFAQHDYSREPMVIEPSDRDIPEHGAGNNLGESAVRMPANNTTKPPIESYEQLLDRQKKEYIIRRLQWITPDEKLFVSVNGQDKLVALYGHDFDLAIIEREAKNREAAEREAKATAAQEEENKRQRESNHQEGGGAIEIKVGAKTKTFAALLHYCMYLCIRRFL